TARLTINGHLSVGVANGAQVVTCSITPNEEATGQPFQAVAKIYDPLYYRFKKLIAYEPCDVDTESDMDYSREAAAYEYLQETGRTGSFAPLYYGSWTFCLPVTIRGTTQTRPVRMILIELEVLALAMDGYVRQINSGIDQLDFAYRNVMLVPRQPVFSKSNITMRRPHEDWPRPCNPILFFWDQSMDEFGGWVPPEWYLNRKLMEEWLQGRFGTEKVRNLYHPVEEELLYRDHPDGATSKCPPATTAKPNSSSGSKAGGSHRNPNYEPPLSLMAHRFRVCVFKPRDH
ncbi:hypothetical protein DHEL01_v208550, partial [Diaporthe helianthi]